MNEFKHEIMEYELSNFDEPYIIKIGKKPVIITAVHTMKQNKEEGVKPAEMFTKSITQYVADKSECSYYIKLKDNGIESNSIVEEEFKTNLLDIIKKNNIKLVIDIHGADLKHGFDVEIGNLNNLSSDFSTIKELEEAFKNNGIKEIINNTKFKGGGITKTVYGNTDIDVLQIEVSRKFRDYNNFDNIEKLCNSLIEFLNQYNNKQEVEIMNNIKTPQMLLDYMKKEFKYGWIGFDGSVHVEDLKNLRELYCTASLETMINTKLVTCVESAVFAKTWFDANNIDCKIFCHRSYETEDNFDKEVKMHIIILYKEKDKWIHFEYSNRPNQGLHEYATIDSALETITSPFAKKNDIRKLTELNDIPSGLSFKELNNYVNNFENTKNTEKK